jgi:hypothetical protein
LNPLTCANTSLRPGVTAAAPKPPSLARAAATPPPVLLCDKCLERGLEVILLSVRTWQRDNNRVMICGGCYRPILTLDTHLEVKRLNPSG